MYRTDSRATKVARPLRRLAAVALLLPVALIVACAAPATPVPEPTALPPTPIAAPLATEATTGAADATTVNVKALETDNGMAFEVDRAVVPAGDVHIVFENAGEMTHEIWLYPVQDTRAMMALKRLDQTAHETDYLKGVVGGLEDVEPGQTKSLDGVVEPGFYELACFKRSKNDDGTTYVHYDKGQFFTIAVTGPGGPSEDVATAGNAMNVEIMDGTDGSWLMVPDKLVVSAGEVTFNVTNQMEEMHDLTIYPIGDVSGFVTTKLAGEKPAYATINGIEVLADIPAGETGTKAETFAPGVYVAVCFIASQDADGTRFLHSDRGQRFVFTVE